MKYHYSGDPEFSLERYWQLPYTYVLDAIIELNTLEREALHNFERPITYLAFQTAEMNRDNKKRRKAFKPDDFYFYASQDDLNLPNAKYGAAALALIRKEMFPSWALFVYADLKARASNALPPELLCFQCDDAILLAPDVNNNIASGMLIAAKSASTGVRQMRSPCGHKITARLPEINDKFEAFEDAELRILA